MSIRFKFDNGDFKELPVTLTAIIRVAISRVRINNSPVKITYYVDNNHDVELSLVAHHVVVSPDTDNNNKFIVKYID